MRPVVLSEIGAWTKTAELDGNRIIVRDQGPPLDHRGQPIADEGGAEVAIPTSLPRRTYAMLLTEVEARALRDTIDEWFPRELDAAGASEPPVASTRKELPDAFDLSDTTDPLIEAPAAATVLLPETFVHGDPMPKGSGSRKLIPAYCPQCKTKLPLKYGIGKLGPFIETANLKTKSRGSNALARWEDSVARAAMRNAALIADAEADDAVELELVFYMQRPKSAKRPYPTVKPDGDKLLRAVQDALHGIAYDDDSQVTDTIVRRRYADSREPGVVIRARLLGAQQIELPL